jgi:hypothetical protein
MPVTHSLIGTGITTRVSTQISAPFCAEEVAAGECLFEALGQESTFEGIAVSWEGLCQDLLDKAQLPPQNKLVHVYSNGSWTDDVPEDWSQGTHKLKPGECFGDRRAVIERRYGIDSQAWFADHILQRIHLVRRLIARGDTAIVAHMTLSLGMLMTTATMKFTWETDTLLGQARREEIQDRARKSAQVRGGKKQQRLNAVRKAADERWTNHPDWTISDVIRDIRKQEQFKTIYVNTLRGDLSKPEEWSTTFKSRKQKT